jgi:hypothetical protein
MATSPSISARLAAGLLFINLFVYALVVFSLYQVRLQYEHHTRHVTQNLAHSLAINITGVLDKMDVALCAVAHETRRQLIGGGIKGEVLNRYIAQEHAQLPEFAAMWVADAAGNVLFGSPLPPPPGKPVTIADREYFSRLINTQDTGLVISKPVISRITQEWVVLVCRRINYSDGSLAGVAFGSLRVVDYFTRMFAPIDVGKRGLIALLDAESGVIVSYPETSENSDQVGSKVLTGTTLDLVRTNRYSGSYTAITEADHIERTCSYRKSSRYPFYLFVAQSTRDYLAPWSKEAAIALSLLGCFTLVTLCSAWLIHKQINETLAQQTLERHSDNLEMLVKERTTDLAELTERQGRGVSLPSSFPSIPVRQTTRNCDGDHHVN